MKQTDSRKRIFYGLLMLGLSGQLVACSAKVAADDPPPVATRFSDPKATIPGPDATGDWRSSCIDPRTGTSGSRRIQVVFKDNTVVRTQSNFSDQNCQTLQSTSVQT